MALIRTARLTLRPWRETDKPAFAALNADPEVAADLGGPLSRAASDAKLDRYRAIFERHGFSRLVIEDSQQAFMGYAGVMPSAPNHPLGPHTEIGWRLARAAWGKGYASEAAHAVLEDAFAKGVREVLAYTAGGQCALPGRDGAPWGCGAIRRAISTCCMATRRGAGSSGWQKCGEP